MEERMTKSKLMDLLQTAHAEWDSLLAQVGEERMAESGVAGDWSVKDIIAHVTWGEREILPVFRRHELVGSELWDLPQNERNAAVFEQNRNRALQEVLAESRQVYGDLLQALAPLSDEDLNDPGGYKDMPAVWQPWNLISENTYEHYADHANDIRAWLNKSAA
jgi:hypothetical protein